MKISERTCHELDNWLSEVWDRPDVHGRIAFNKFVARFYNDQDEPFDDSDSARDNLVAEIEDRLLKRHPVSVAIDNDILGRVSLAFDIMGFLKACKITSVSIPD
jgi:hypothetical protein